MDDLAIWFQKSIASHHSCFGSYGTIVLYEFLLIKLKKVDKTGFCLRFANAFSYYGIVLLTTEMFQIGNACKGISLNFDKTFLILGI